MKIREIKWEAKQALKGKWGLAILFSILTFAINSFIPLLMEILFSGGFNAWSNSDNPPAGAQLVSWIFTIALSPVIYGYYSVFLDMERSNPVSVKKLFHAFDASIYFKVLGIYFLSTLYTILWSLLLLIPGIIKAIAYSQIYFILKDDQNIGINEAITKSRKLMDGYKGNYFLLLLSFVGWAIIGIFTIGIAFLWIIPYYTASLAAFYEKLPKDNGSKKVEL
ncbi:DUF975 family protein [Neobacillus sp. SM06]|uniref:DUF975 family protein n=1 Tax=Neobacillus sp. SM06 TaxID=3422492 RepID=UPI003D2D9E8E